MKAFVPVLAIAFVGGGMLGAIAAEKTIGQKGKMFSETEAAVKVGESLIFMNDDNIAHNILSTSSGNEFNLGSQAPGASTSVTFKSAGDVKVTCAIHPRMQMTVKVTN
jgi:plastocyanin